MDRLKVKRDFAILTDNHARLARAGRPPWSRHTWKVEGDSAFELFLFDYRLPASARPRSVHVKIEGRATLYDPAGRGQYHFYRNVWLSAPVQVSDRGAPRPLPRLWAPDAQGWRYLCVHPGLVAGDQNVLNFLRILDLYVLNA